MKLIINNEYITEIDGNILSTNQLMNNNDIVSVKFEGEDIVLGNNLFMNCSNLKELDLSNVRNIGYQCFMNCGIETLIIPKCVKKINNWSWTGNPIKHVYSEELNCTLDLSDITGINANELQNIIDNMQKYSKIILSEDDAIYMNTCLIMGDKAHWENNEIHYGGIY